MADNLGSYNTSSSRTHVRFQFTTHAAAGGLVAPQSAFEAADLRIYKATDGAAFSATQRSSANGITMTSPFDSVVGLHDVDIDLTDNTDAGFYVAGSRYSVILLPDETVDSQTVGRVLANFDIGPPPVNVTQLLGTAWLTPAVAGTPDVNAKLLGGTSQTGRDIGASVLLSAGTGTGQLDFTSGVVKSNWVQYLGTALGGTAAQVVASITKFFNVATPTGTINSLPDAVPGDAGGVFIAGTNAALTITGAVAFQNTFTVTGAVALNAGLAVSSSSGDAVRFTSSFSGGHGFYVTGNGSGDGAHFIGGASGAGLKAQGGASAGYGIDATGGGANAYGISAAGTSGDFRGVFSTADAIPAAAVSAAAVTKIQNGLATTAAIPTAIENADALLKRDMSAVTGEAARSPLNAFRFLRNLWSIAAGVLTVKKEDDTTTAWTATVSTDAAAEPIIGSDPS